MIRMASSLLSNILKILEILLAALLFMMIVLTFADVVGRYIFSKPIFGAAEMIEFILAASIFLGLAIVNALDENISIDMFEHYVRSRIPKIHSFIVNGVTLVIMGVIGWQFVLRTIDDINLNSRTVVLEWPLYWITGTICVLSFVAIICQLLGLMTAKRIEHNNDILRGIE